MAITVMFADDQIPFANEKDNKAIKEEICKEFEVHRRQEAKITSEGFDDDFKYFESLVKYLVSDKGVKIIKVQSFNEALRRIQNYNPNNENEDEQFDVAIIDLSWWGDKNLPSGYEGRHNKGYELLEHAQKKFDENGIFIPTIAYSQNFYEQPNIMGEVIKRGALPIPKINRKDDDEKKREMGYHTLFSAIEQLKNLHPVNDYKRRALATFEMNYKRKSRNFEIILYVVLSVLLIALLIPLIYPIENPKMSNIIQALLGAGGASILAWAWKDQRASRKDLSTITKDFGVEKG